MASERQVRANRENAQRSTGPRTAEGKAAVRHNALTHGVLAKSAILPGEDEEQFAALAERIRIEVQPAGALEHLLVNRVADCAWRLRRLIQVEAGIFTRLKYGEIARDARDEARSCVSDPRAEPFRQLSEYFDGPQVVLDEGRHATAIKKAHKAEEVRDGEIARLGSAFLRGSDEFAKLSRYETSIERSMFHALDELRRLQERRAANPPTALLALRAAEGQEESRGSATDTN